MTAVTKDAGEMCLPQGDCVEKTGSRCCFSDGHTLAVFTGLGLQREIRRADRNLNANKVALDPPPPSTVEVLTYHNDVARTGRTRGENPYTRQREFQSIRQGRIYSCGRIGGCQPLYISNLTVSGHSHNVLFVATEHDSVYAFDADNWPSFGTYRARRQ